MMRVMGARAFVSPRSEFDEDEGEPVACTPTISGSAGRVVSRHTACSTPPASRLPFCAADRGGAVRGRREDVAQVRPVPSLTSKT